MDRLLAFHALYRMSTEPLSGSAFGGMMFVGEARGPVSGHVPETAGSHHASSHTLSHQDVCAQIMASEGFVLSRVKNRNPTPKSWTLGQARHAQLFEFCFPHSVEPLISLPWQPEATRLRYERLAEHVPKRAWLPPQKTQPVPITGSACACLNPKP